jgi:HD-GYP domain-containing protein (c-di-GMP phosphodiesterase class II)
MQWGTERVRMTELLAALSLATDIGTGRPLGHGARTCLNATAIGMQMGFDSEQLRTLFQVSLLRFLGCTADSHESAAAVGGDEVSFNGAMGPVFFGGVTEMARAMATSVGTSESLPRRGRLLVGALTDTKSARDGLAAHCEVAAILASRLGMEERVVDALRHVYERWDGKGFPSGIRGEEIAIEARICAVAGDADLVWSNGTDPDVILRKRSGKGYDPEVVEAWRTTDLLPAENDWEVLLATEPEPVVYVEDLDSALTTMADFTDLKSPWTRGHSRAVSDLAAKAADIAGHDPPEIRHLKRAGLVHDLGRVGVENGIWDKPGALTTFEWEKVRIHSYVTSRILSMCPALEGLEPLAASHHERMDGSGYHRQWAGDQLSGATRILAAADVMAALRSARPHRPPLGPEEAVSVLGDEVRSGRLDGSAVAYVVSAAGGEFDRPISANPDGLTDREVEVLRHIAAGTTNRGVADALFISTKTVGRHVENIYVKIGVSTRAGAAVYAMEHGLLR